MNLNQDQNGINLEVEREIDELKKRIKTLEALLNGGSTKTVYVALTSGGAVTSILNVEKGIIK